MVNCFGTITRLYRRLRVFDWVKWFTYATTFSTIILAIFEGVQFFEGFTDGTAQQISACVAFAKMGLVNFVLSVIFYSKNRWMREYVLMQTYMRHDWVHQLLGINGVVCFTLHGAGFLAAGFTDLPPSLSNYNVDAIIAWSLMIVMPLASFFVIRQLWFTLSKYVHVFLILLIVMFASSHSNTFAIVMSITLFLYFVTNNISCVSRHDHHKLRFKKFHILPGMWTRLDMDTGGGDVENGGRGTELVAYKPGQFYLMNFPRIEGFKKLLEYHPIYAVHQGGAGKVNELQFYVAVQGDHTRAIYNYAMDARAYMKEQRRILKANNGDMTEVENMRVDFPITMDGPHGGLNLSSTDLRNYRSILFIVEGVGSVAFQSYLNDWIAREELLLMEGKGPSALTQITFVWGSYEDRNITKDYKAQGASLQQLRYLCFQPNLLEPEGINKIGEHHQINFYLHLMNVKDCNSVEFRDGLSEEDNLDLPALATHAPNNTRLGAADDETILNNVDETVLAHKRFANDNDLDRIAVLVSGGPELIKEVRKSCKYNTSFRCPIEIHEEITVLA